MASAGMLRANLFLGRIISMHVGEGTRLLPQLRSSHVRTRRIKLFSSRLVFQLGSLAPQLQLRDDFHPNLLCRLRKALCGRLHPGRTLSPCHGSAEPPRRPQTFPGMPRAAGRRLPRRHGSGTDLLTPVQPSSGCQNSHLPGENIHNCINGDVRFLVLFAQQDRTEFSSKLFNILNQLTDIFGNLFTL
ncbi:uncharacterized protein LOC129201940 isoform X2 [Grus americana]|uniref:uncharacterized protein LOC129200286 isoform X2 n=1 Tax=Grus americana TaxID=9117 RepID=UPI0024087D8C|nr:uncharacterized protein LOC129200286 isoform X2 [Grus americana]XP_054669910.1 uncharacterized protein LOC129201940 isoform X2 [Grus americana]